MRRIITCLIALLFFSLQISAQQVPNGFNYQSIARDAMGLPIVNSQIKLRITVRQNSTSGTDVWQETQTAITNQFGLINLVIGNGTKSGGLASITGINSIDWSSDNFFIVVEVDNGGAYVSLGITQFQSVPYALASDNTLKIQGTKVGAIIPTANQFLKFNSLSGQWEPGNISGANGGTVISVGGIGPISITGNAGLAPQVNILQSSAIQDGYLSALDWAVFANKLGTTTGFSGDVSGTYNALTVTGIQNIPVTSTAPTNGQILMYDGIQWVPTTTGATSGVTTVIGSGEISVSPGSSPVISILTASGISNGIITTADYISFSNKLTINSIAGGDLSGPYNNLIVTKIGGVPVSLASAPTGSVLSFNGIGFVPAVLTSTVNITSTTPGVSASGSTINITTADGTNFGLLTPTDYNLFTNKVGIASSASGDVSGSYQDGFTVTGLGTKSLNITGILPGQVLSFNGTSFVPGTPSASQLTSVTGINGIIVGGSGSLYSVDGSNLITVTTLFGGDLNGTYNSITVNRVQNIPFSLAGITNGQYLYFNGASIVGFNVPSAIVPTLTGINGITLNTNTGYNFTISGQTLATYSGDNLLTTLTGTFPNFTIAGISQAQNATTLVGINGLSVAGSSFSQTIIGQSFVGTNGIVVSSTGNVFTITNTIPGLSLFGDGINTSVTGGNNNYTVLGIAANQTLNTISGINGIKIVTGTGFDFSIDGTNFITSIIGSNGLTVFRSGQFFTVAGANTIGATYSGDNLLTTLTGTFPNLTIAGIAQSIQNTTLTGSNGLSVAGSGLSQTVIGQSFVGTNGIVISSTGRTFTISNTTPGLSLFGDGVNTSVTGSNNNYTVLGIGSGSQWISSGSDKIYTNSFVGIGAANPGNPLVVQSNIVSDIAFFESFDPAGSTIRVYNGGTDGARIKLESGSTFILENRVSVVGFNFSGSDFLTFNNVNSTVGINAIGGVVNIGRSGQSSNLSVTGTTYTKSLKINSLSNGLLTVDGLGNVTTTSLNITSSQWTNTTSGNIFYSGGKIGVGNINPTSDIHVFNGTTSSSIRVESSIPTGGAGITLATDAQTWTTTVHGSTNGSGNPGEFLLYDGIATSTRFRVMPLTGNIVIGGALVPANEKLTVEGNATILGIGYANGFSAAKLTLTGIGSGILTVDGLGNVTTTSLSFTTTQTTLTGSNGLSVSGSGFSQTIIGQSFIGTNGIVVSSTGNTFTITNTAPGLSLFGDGTITSVVGSNNNYTVLGIGNSSQWINTLSGIYYSSVVGIGIVPASNSGLIVKAPTAFNNALTLKEASGTYDLFGVRDNTSGVEVSFYGPSNTVNSVISGDPGVPSYIINELGIGTTTPNEKLTIQGNTSISGIGYASGLKASNLTLTGIGSGILTVDGFGNVTTTSLNFSTTQTTLTGANGLSVSGSGFSQTIIGQSFVGTNGIVVSSTGNAFTISNTTPGLSLFGDGINTSVVGANNNYTVLGIGATSQWVSTTGGIYYPIGVGINALPLTTPSTAPLTIGTSSTWDIAFVPGGGGNATIHSIQDLILLSDNSLTFRTNNIDRLNILTSGQVGIGTQTPNEELTVQGNSSVSGIGYASGFKAGTLTLTGIGSGILTVDGFGNVTTTSLSFATTQTTLVGFNGISVAGSGFSQTIIGQSFVGTNGIVVSSTGNTFTIDGSAFVNTTTAGLKDVKGNFQNGFTVTGLAGAPINTPAILPGYALQFDGTSIVGSSFVNTIVGTGGLTVGTITGGYSIDGSNLVSGTIVGTAGLSVAGTGLSKTVSGVGLVVLQQSLGSTMGSAATTFNTISGTAMFKVPVKIPVNVKTVTISLNAYGLVGSTFADYIVMIGNSASPISVNSNDPDNIVSLPDLDVSTSQGQTVMLKVYGKVSGLETAAYLQGITITVKD